VKTSRYQAGPEPAPPACNPSPRVFDPCQSIRLGVCVGLRYTSAATWLGQFGIRADGNLGEEREPLGMSESLHMIAGVDRQDEPLYTLQEILQQPVLWPTTVARVRAASEQLSLARRLSRARVLLTGAGSSAYAASSVAAAWPGAIAIPTTDLVVDAERYLPGVGAVISLARSGDSPESAAVVDRVRALHPEILQLAITCNHDSLLAQSGLDGLIVLDPRTNDRSLVMTGSFSNLVLGGLSLAQPELVAQHTDSASESCCPPSMRDVSASQPAPATVSLCCVPRRCWRGAGRRGSKYWK
jgi:hypothetical protein